MRCYSCGRELEAFDHCRFCGASVRTYKKALAISNALYNEGLEQASSRDLSGAIESLNKSLKFNKENIDARNLLGLVYFEIGEVVDALSEWVISNNMQPEDNLATYYLKEIQSNPNKLEILNQTIKKYNQALIYCQQGSNDLAVIQLKKILSTNPNFVKAQQLLALLYFQQEEYEKTRKTLNKAFKINKTDSTTLRYMNELDQVYHKGTKGRPEPKKTENGAKKVVKKLFSSGNGFNDSSFNGLINVIFGVVLGILATVFLIVPAVKHNSTSSTSNSLISANEQLADKSSEIGSLQKKIADLEAEKASLAESAAQVTQIKESYSALYQAMNTKNPDALEMAELVDKINPEVLDDEAKASYQTIKESSDKAAVSAYFKKGETSLNASKFEDAITYLTKTITLQEDYQNYDAMLKLGKAYIGLKDYDKAREYLNKVIDKAGKDSNAGKAAQTAINNDMR